MRCLQKGRRYREFPLGGTILQKRGGVARSHAWLIDKFDLEWHSQFPRGNLALPPIPRASSSGHPLCPRLNDDWTKE